MKKVYISKNYRDRYTASSKAKMDVEEIARNSGFKNIGLPQTSIKNAFGKVITYFSNIIGVFRLPTNGIVLCQYPTYGIAKFISAAKRKNNKIIIIIHDINMLRNLEDDSLRPLYEADILIAHNAKMKQWLQYKGINKEIRILKVFDYIAKDDIESPSYPIDGRFTICFAGNLNKSKFLNELSPAANEFKVFGIGSENLKLKKNVKYMGTYTPDVLRLKLNSHFGLVWDGTSCSTCDGLNGEYLKYIAPHKLSMYLSSNLPVIVWEKSAMADFVRTHNIGLTIGNLDELDSVTNKISYSQYNEIVDNAKRIGKKIRRGEFLASVLNEI